MLSIECTIDFAVLGFRESADEIAGCPGLFVRSLEDLKINAPRNNYKVRRKYE